MPPQPLRLTLLVVARSDLPQIAALVRALKMRSSQFSFQLVHITAQGDLMEHAFADLEIPAPDVVVSACSAQTTFSATLANWLPHWLLMIDAEGRGDDAVDALVKKGMEKSRIHMVGDLAMDTVGHFYPTAIHLNPRYIALANRISGDVKEPLIEQGGYALLTVQDLARTDNDTQLQRWVGAFLELSETLPIVWPLTPQIHHRLTSTGLLNGLQATGNITLCEPLRYVELLALQVHSQLVLTDDRELASNARMLDVPVAELGDSVSPAALRGMTALERPTSRNVPPPDNPCANRVLDSLLAAGS